MHTSGFGEGEPVFFGSDDARRGIVVALRVVTQTRHTFSPACSPAARSGDSHSYRGDRQFDAAVLAVTRMKPATYLLSGCIFATDSSLDLYACSESP